MYILPTDGFMWDFVKERINAILDFVKAYKNTSKSFRSPDSLSLKRLFGVPLKFVGAHNRKNFYSFTARFLSIDEYDLCNQDNLVFAEDRLLSAFQSEAPIRRYFGNPSIPGFGIDDLFDKSDKKEYMLKCPRCNTWQELDWFRNFIRQIDDFEYELRDPRYSKTTTLPSVNYKDDSKCYCIKCERDFNRLQAGYWIKHNKTVPISGYHISRLFADSRRIPVILDLFFAKGGFLEALLDETKYQRFLNNLLGIAFISEGSSITETILNNCIGDYYTPDFPPKVNGKIDELVAGVDVNSGAGHRIHIEQVLENGKRKKLLAQRVKNFAQLQQIVDEWNVSVGVIDAQPETEKTIEFCRDNPGWFRCYYPGTSQIKSDFKISYKEQYIQADRTSSLDRSYQDWRLQNVSVAKDFRNWNQGKFIAEMGAATRVYNEKKNGYDWKEGSKDDHDQHADNYVRMAANLLSGGSGIEIIQ